MSEQLIAEGIQTIIRTIDEFDDDSVTLSDWAILDDSLFGSPFVRIDVSDTFESTQDTKSPMVEWEIMVTLLVAFDDWTETHLLFRDTRQLIIDKFNEVGTNRAAGLDLVDIHTIKSVTDIEPVYPQYEEGDDPDPIFLAQVMVFEAREDS